MVTLQRLRLPCRSSKEEEASMHQLAQTASPAPALVAKAHGAALSENRYLRLSPDGAAAWVDDPKWATAFPSMREATRAAFRLPASLRAYGLPRASELSRGLYA
jgi:hypothetical protein